MYVVYLKKEVIAAFHVDAEDESDAIDKAFKAEVNDDVERVWIDNTRVEIDSVETGDGLIEVHKTYYPNGNLNCEIHYKDGKRDGLCRAFYENGNSKVEVNYKDGKYNGLFRVFYENGNLETEANYKDDERTGICKRFYKYGKLKWEITYTDGKPDGVRKEYYADGRLKRETNYRTVCHS